MPKWFSRRLRSSRAWRLSMPSFLKKSSSGARELAGAWKCLEAGVRTSWGVWSIVRMDRSIYHPPYGHENSRMPRVNLHGELRDAKRPNRSGRTCALDGHLALDLTAHTTEQSVVGALMRAALAHCWESKHQSND